MQSVKVHKNKLVVGGAFLIALLFFFVPESQAQIGPLNAEAFNVTLMPEYPRPKEVVLVRVQSFLHDLDTAVVTFFANGKKIAGEKGLKEVTLTMGDVGEVVTVTVLAEKNGAIIGSSEKKVTPVSVAVIWEALSVIPPFYKGKALPSPDTRVRVVAIPTMTNARGQSVAAKDLTYRWYQNGTYVPAQSGRGRDAIMIQNSRAYSNIFVSVEVVDSNSGVKTSGYANITPTEPKIVLYEEHPFWGYWFGAALTGLINVQKEEMVLRAIPFFFSSDTPLSYEWGALGQKQSGATEHSLTLHPQGEGVGRSILQVAVKNPQSLFQFANASVTVEFNTTTP